MYKKTNSNISVWRSFSIGSSVFLQSCLTTLWAGLPFHGHLYHKHPWKTQRISLSGAKSRYVYCVTRDLSSLSSGFWSLNSTHCVCKCHVALFPLLQGDGVWGMLVMWLLLLLWAIIFFPDLEPHVFYQLPGNCGTLTCELSRRMKS